MPTFTLDHWNAVPGAVGYNVHSGIISGVPTDMTDVGNTLGPVTILVPWSGSGYAVVAAYDANHFEGLYSAEISVVAGAGSIPPIATIVAALR